MWPSTPVLLELLLLSPLVAAVPLHDARSPWRKLSDGLVQRIWGALDHEKSLDIDEHVMGPRVHSASERKLLAGYSESLVLRFNISTSEEAAALAEASETLFLDVWEFNEDWVDIQLAESVVPSLLGLLPSSLRHAHVPLMRNIDLAQAIVDSYPAPSATRPHENNRFSPSLYPSRSKRQHPFFQDYQPYSVIEPWMDLTASMFSTHVRKISIGKSYEGRDISALRVGVHPTNDEQPSSRRKTVLITGGSHAREWISTSTVNYIAWSLISSYGRARGVTKLLEEFDFVFVPTLNPDGYVYSWETDRLWRKNRQPTSLRFCHGIDLDRSYSFHWDGDKTHSNPCSESYAGDTAFDAVEAKGFADWAKNETEHNNVEFWGLIDLHSYSQQILYPYSYSCDQLPPTLEDLEELGLGLAKAIRTSRRGHTYKVASACEGNVAIAKDGKKRVMLPRMESNGGSALDWFYHDLSVKYAYQIKLRDTGSYGFLLPRENIVPTGEEVLEGVLYFGRFLLDKIGVAATTPRIMRPQEAHDDAAESASDVEADTNFELRRRR
ncbi:hypothetical protein M011DRAFT_394788 [Sporormia fimetaria CBS 119925]|uniref:Inactive metallocarboxypeptidase ECM14 n=1 Tax=Sporormia fimetaria CBS 119925 TaxID=1340428 RepID=A0A6A6VKZ0_9PLEO|nr:hypothetical protein M011DRAFT_394788 [Sporormia fimetaria CBS 119925]